MAVINVDGKEMDVREFCGPSLKAFLDSWITLAEHLKRAHGWEGSVGEVCIDILTITHNLIDQDAPVDNPVLDVLVHRIVERGLSKQQEETSTSDLPTDALPRLRDVLYGFELESLVVINTDKKEGETDD